MISSITGELKRVDTDRVQLAVGAVTYELLVPAADITELHVSLGETVTFHTIFYLGGDPTRGNLEPTLIGFLRPDDKRFFNIFTTVKGIGVRTALRALTVPVGEIAQAIEGKDNRFLVGLNGVGKRTAELIIAELAGKVKDFAYAGPAGAKGAATGMRRPDLEEDAIAGLLALGERSRADAERLLERAKATNPSLKTTDGFLREMLRLRTVRA